MLYHRDRRLQSDWITPQLDTVDVYARGHLGYKCENREKGSMLTHISISNYTIVSDLEMEFAPGMTDRKSVV